MANRTSKETCKTISKCNKIKDKDTPIIKVGKLIKI